MGKLTPRKLQNLFDGYEIRRKQEITDYAIQAIMYRRAMNEKRISVRQLTGFSDTEKVVSIEERKKQFEEAVKLMGPDVKPVRRAAK